VSTSENKTIVRHFWEDGYNNRNLDLMDQLLTADYIHHSNKTPMDRAAFREAAEGFQRSFPDSRVKIEHLIEEQPLVVVRWWFTGTHTTETEMWGAPTHTVLSFPSTWICQLADGKIREDWETWDTLPVADRLRLPVL